MGDWSFSITILMTTKLLCLKQYTFEQSQLQPGFFGACNVEKSIEKSSAKKSADSFYFFLIKIESWTWRHQKCDKRGMI